MMASEVPTHSCMRSSSGTPRMRKTSNSTGTMTAPPPMPNSPARIPVTSPATMTAAASQASSATGMPQTGVAAEPRRSGLCCDAALPENLGDQALGDRIGRELLLALQRFRFNRLLDRFLLDLEMLAFHEFRLEEFRREIFRFEVFGFEFIFSLGF